MRLTLPKRGPYRGRLAFDPSSGYHIDPAGRKVVTDDAGVSWRYARRGDRPHIARYSTRIVVVDSTANRPDDQPHHFQVQPDDPHHNDAAPGTARLLADADGVAEFVTSHTDAWK